MWCSEPDPAPPPRGLKPKVCEFVESEVCNEPDPAPPPRGLKRVNHLLRIDASQSEPDPAPPPRGLKPDQGHLSVIVDTHKSPTPPHLRGD